MSVAQHHLDWLNERADGLVVGIHVENAIMSEFQHVMDGEVVNSYKARQARVWIDARRLRDDLVREREAILAVLGELNHIASSMEEK